MTEQQHPITPPPELVEQWINEPGGLNAVHIATQAARWGADQELEACCGLIGSAYVRDQVRAARRPKPPSLAEQALMGLEQTVIMLMPVTGRKQNERFNIIRRALERLQELESDG